MENVKSRLLRLPALPRSKVLLDQQVSSIITIGGGSSGAGDSGTVDPYVVLATANTWQLLQTFNKGIEILIGFPFKFTDTVIGKEMISQDSGNGMLFKGDLHTNGVFYAGSDVNIGGNLNSTSGTGLNIVNNWLDLGNANITGVNGGLNITTNSGTGSLSTFYYDTVSDSWMSDRLRGRVSSTVFTEIGGNGVNAYVEGVSAINGFKINSETDSWLLGGKFGIYTNTPIYDIHVNKNQISSTVISVENLNTSGNSEFKAISELGELSIKANGNAVGSYPDSAVINVDGLTNGINLLSTNYRFKTDAGVDIFTMLGTVPKFEYSTQFSANISSPTFTSGFGGSGWQVDRNDDATFDNITIRKAMKVYELQIEKIKSGNGSYWFSDGAKVDFTSSDATHIFLYWEDSLINPFVDGDIIRVQQFSGNNIKYWENAVTAVGASVTYPGYHFTSMLTASMTGLGTPEDGDEIVRVGSTSTAARRGAVYITSNDDDSPYMDVINGLSTIGGSFTTKARIGRLDGITDTNAGLDGTQIDYFGLYTDNGHFKGHLFSTSGTIAGWELSDLSLKSSDGRTMIHKTYGFAVSKNVLNETNPLSGNDRINMHYTGSTDWGIVGIDSVGNELFNLGSSNTIAGFTFDNNKLFSDNLEIDGLGGDITLSGVGSVIPQISFINPNSTLSMEIIGASSSVSFIKTYHGLRMHDANDFIDIRSLSGNLNLFANDDMFLKAVNDILLNPSIGNVGVNMINPTETFEVTGSIGLTGRINQTGTANELDINPYSILRLGRSTLSASFEVQIFTGTGTSVNHNFKGVGNSYICSNNGLFGIGVTSVGARLHVKAIDNSTSTNVFRLDDGSGVPTVYIRNSGTVYLAKTYNETSVGAANVYMGGSGRLYRSTSSIEAKKDVIYDVDPKLALNLKPAYFTEKSTDKPYIGFIAEDSDSVDSRFATNQEEDGMMGLDINSIVSATVSTVQYNNRRIAELGLKIIELEDLIIKIK